MQRQSIETRFWTKVLKTKSCWLWTASRMPKGYGKIGAGGGGNGWLYAHRVSWELTNGPIPTGMLVLHHCDNPPCVNPAHLFLGSISDNSQDMLRKDRHSKVRQHGSSHWKAKLTETQVIEMRNQYAAGGITHQGLADHYGVSRQLVYFILSRHNWKHC